MKKTFATLAASISLLLGTVGSAAGFDLDKDKMAKIKTVAVVTIAGPRDIGLFHYPTQENFAHLEAALPGPLSAANLQLVPLDKTRAVIDSDWTAAYAEFLKPEHQAFVRKNKEKVFSTLSQLSGLARQYSFNYTSPNTAWARDYYGSPDQFQGKGKLTPSFKQAMAKVMQKLNADGYILMNYWVGPEDELAPAWDGGTIKVADILVGHLILRLFNAEGDLVFRDDLKRRYDEHLDLGFLGIGSPDFKKFSPMVDSMLVGLYQIAVEDMKGK